MLKQLIEKRNALIEEMEGLLNTIKTEKRAFNQTETTRIEAIKSEVVDIDNTIKTADEFRSMEKTQVKSNEDLTKEQLEERAFDSFIRGKVTELRAGEQNVTVGNNGAIIPTTIANRIINTVKQISPILAKATIFNVKGTLKIPKWGLANTTHDIAVGYQTEFVDITADAGKFTSIDLTGFLAGALVLVSKSVINNAQFDVVAFVVGEMARKIAVFMEKEILTGAGTTAATGAVGAANSLTTAGATAITADELIGLQAKVIQAYQANASWIMHPDTFTYIRKLKYADGKYLLQETMTNEFPYMLLGKPVFLSENMDTIAATKKTILYGDYSGIAVKISENLEIQVLMEKYATQHAVGVVGYFEFDSKIMDEQRLAVLVQHA